MCMWLQNFWSSYFRRNSNSRSPQPYRVSYKPPNEQRQVRDPSGEELLKNTLNRNEFKAYLIGQQGQFNTKSNARKVVELYELSVVIIENENLFDKNRAEIENLLFTAAWQKRLNNLEQEEMSNFFEEVKEECGKQLDSDRQMRDFIMEEQ